MQTIIKTSKPSKQRKLHFKAPDHVRYRKFSAPLTPDLRKSYGTRSLPIRRGDSVRVMRGDRKGFEGKVARVDRKNYRVYIEGLTREKVDGTTVSVPIHPSKVMITRLNLDDKWRKKILERRKKAVEAVEAAEKPQKIVEVEGKAAEEKEAAKEVILEKEKPKRRRKAAEKMEGGKEEPKMVRRRKAEDKTGRAIAGKTSEGNKLG
ncbi:MAG: 50S ribosomal protein L24 [Candidatus Bathyarchaeia archaeon]